MQHGRIRSSDCTESYDRTDCRFPFYSYLETVDGLTILSNRGFSKEEAILALQKEILEDAPRKIAMYQMHVDVLTEALETLKRESRTP